MRDSDSLKLKYKCVNPDCKNSWVSYTKPCDRKDAQICETCFHTTDRYEVVGVYSPNPQVGRGGESNCGAVVDDDVNEYYSVGC